MEIHMIFDLEDLTDETIAQAAADALVVEAIVASEANRRKRQKVRSCTSKIKRLVKLCRVKMATDRAYGGPIKTVKRSFEMLEEERGEMDVNLFGI